MSNEFKTLPIWNRFIRTNDSNFNIDELFDNALALLDRYYTAFPKYTLHNTRHIYNILKIMGELLDNRINELSNLECIILILSSVYHDIGMIFSEKQLTEITQEENFDDFLNANYSAKLQFIQKGEQLDESLVEWYCRWTHAKRVWHFITVLEQNRYKNYSLRIPIGNICESHNDDALQLYSDSKFPTNYIFEADLKFCSVLLRLSDILDFDNSRTPKSVYEFLDLDNPKNKSEEISQTEWNKHLASNGFTFDHHNQVVELKFSAAPQHPQIENNIQTFLNVIEDEIVKCKMVISKCSPRWQNFDMSLKIDRSGIVPQGYLRGDFKLSLDENKIIELLTGDNLYENDFIFIREILQNSIDSSRMREVYEDSQGKSGFTCDPILITAWADQDGSMWLRVDDFGMGLNEYIVSNHLLKKGASFYKSDYFKLIQHEIKNKTDKDFTPISRFGIGLLSCFMMGDKVEISSKSLPVRETNAFEEKIRLSIPGQQGQYALQTNLVTPEPHAMPSKNGLEKSFRQKHGTSIAIRLSGAKIDIHFYQRIKLNVQSFVLCSPILIKFQGENIGVDYTKALNTPLCQRKFLPFDDNQKATIEKLIQKQIIGEIGIEAIPIDLTKNSVDENLKGQIAIFKLKTEYDYENEFWDGWDMRFDFSDKNSQVLILAARRIDPITNQSHSVSESISCNELFNKLIDEEWFSSLFLRQSDESRFRRGLTLIHNGINFPNIPSGDRRYFDTKLALRERLFQKQSGHERNGFEYFGFVYFQDKLMPDLAVSRNSITNLPFNVYSSFIYAARTLNEYDERFFFNFLDDVRDYFPFKDIKKDDLIQNLTWAKEPLFVVDKTITSVLELEQIVQKRQIKVFIDRNFRSFLAPLMLGLIKIHFEFEVEIANYGQQYFNLSSVRTSLPVDCALDNYSPWLFLPYENNYLLVHQHSINLNHALGAWIEINQTILMDCYKGYFHNLISSISDKNVKQVNEILKHFHTLLPEANHYTGRPITEKDFTIVGA